MPWGGAVRGRVDVQKPSLMSTTSNRPQSQSSSSNRRKGDGGVRRAAASSTAGPGAGQPATASSDHRDEPLVFTPEQAAVLLGVKASWLRRKAAARAVPCTFLGKHLRFSRADLEAIIAAGEQTPRARRRP